MHKADFDLELIDAYILDENIAETMTLFYRHNFTLEVVAECQNVSVSTVKERLRQGRQTIKEISSFADN